MRPTPKNKLLVLLLALIVAAGMAHAQVYPGAPLRVDISGYKGNSVQSDSITVTPGDTAKGLDVVAMYREGNAPVSALKPTLIKKGLKVVVKWTMSPPFTDGWYQLLAGTQTIRYGAVHIGTQGIILPSVSASLITSIITQLAQSFGAGKLDASTFNTFVNANTIALGLKLSIGDTGVFVRKYNGYRLMSTAEGVKLAGLPDGTTYSGTITGINTAIGLRVLTSDYNTDKANTAISLSQKAAQSALDATNANVASVSVSVGVNTPAIADLRATIAADTAYMNNLYTFFQAGVPERESDLIADRGYLTSAPVTSVNGQTGAVVISASGGVTSVNSQTGAVTLTIPTAVTNTNQLTNGSNFITSAGAPVQSVAGRTGAVTLANTDVSGLGTMSTQSAASVAITGGSIGGAAVVSSSAAVQTPLGSNGTYVGQYRLLMKNNDTGTGSHTHFLAANSNSQLAIFGISAPTSTVYAPAGYGYMANTNGLSFNLGSVERFRFMPTGVALFNTTTDNGRDALQVSGSIVSTFASGAGDPTTSQLTAGQCIVWKNTTSGFIKQYCNNAGTIVASAAYN